MYSVSISIKLHTIEQINTSLLLFSGQISFILNYAIHRYQREGKFASGSLDVARRIAASGEIAA